MLTILGCCTPLKILNSIISFDSILVVYVWLAIRIWYKRLPHKTMHFVVFATELHRRIAVSVNPHGYEVRTDFLVAPTTDYVFMSMTPHSPFFRNRIQSLKSRYIFHVLIPSGDYPIGVDNPPIVPI